MKYFNHLMSKQDIDQWTFFELTGCPDGLMTYLVQLAELAQQREIAATMVWLSFNSSPVDKIERAIKEWQNTYVDDIGSQSLSETQDHTSTCYDANYEDECNARADQYHCSEAWRQALLIYIQRVFRWDRISNVSGSLMIRARKTLDHVRCCRYSSQTQKQVLLPVFLAGGEIADEEMRQCVRSYCNWWAERSRYKMFCSVPELLEKVWSTDRSTNSAVWWGSVIDRKSGLSNQQDDFQYLFG